MKNVIRSAAVALALAALAPLAAQAQPKPAAKPLAPTAEQRWGRLLQAAGVLAQEGTEFGRINPAEKKQIDDFIGQTRQFIAQKKQGGITEAEEDSIDNNFAQMYAMIARNMSDPARKAGPAHPPAGGPKAMAPTAEQRWGRLLQAAGVLAHEGMEFGRINPAEKKQIDDFIGQTRQFIAQKKQGGITEAEEDSIDNNFAQMYAMIARNMSDPQRKLPAPARK